jgi:hypothetical protein
MIVWPSADEVGVWLGLASIALAAWFVWGGRK